LAEFKGTEILQSRLILIRVTN